MPTDTETPYGLRVVRLSDYAEGWQVRTMLSDGTVIASVKMRTWTECACVATMFHLETREDYRRQGIASLMLAELEAVARRENISLLALTVRMYNFPCRELIRKAGYTESCAWQNVRTGNDLVLARKVLNLAGGNSI